MSPSIVPPAEAEAEQHPLVADHRAQRLRAGRPVEQEQHVAFETGE